MKTILTFLVVFMAILTTGCARGRWTYPGPASEANRLAYDCQYMANMQAKGSGYMTGAIAESQFRQCLESRGFTWVPESSNYQNTEQNSYSDPDKNKKYKYGFVRIDDLKKNSKYFLKYCSDNNGCADNEVFIDEAQKQAALYCKEYGYDFLTIKNANLKDFGNGYLCSPRESIRGEDLSRFTDGDATGDVGGFVDRTNGMRKVDN